jgi:hypothetical protein
LQLAAVTRGFEDDATFPPDATLAASRFSFGFGPATLAVGFGAGFDAFDLAGGYVLGGETMGFTGTGASLAISARSDFTSLPMFKHRQNISLGSRKPECCNVRLMALPN